MLDDRDVILALYEALKIAREEIIEGMSFDYEQGFWSKKCEEETLPLIEAALLKAGGASDE